MSYIPVERVVLQLAAHQVQLLPPPLGSVSDQTQSHQLTEDHRLEYLNERAVSR